SAGDHRRIVGAQRRRRRDEAQTSAFSETLEGVADAGICRDTASDNERSNRGHLIERAARTIEQAVDGCLLETGGDIGCLVLAALVSAQDRALEAREREVRLGAAEQRTGQRNRFRVAFPR